MVAAGDLVAFFPEMQWGQFVTGGVTRLLPQALGHQRAMELLVLGERQSAEALLRLGLVNWVVPGDRMMAKALEVAGAVAGKSAHSVGELKRLLTRDPPADLETALRREQAITMETFARPEAAERVRVFTDRGRGE